MEIIVEDKDPEKTYIRVPIVKASTKEEPAFVEVCYDDLPEDVLKAILIAGCKVYLNQGMSKITGTKTNASREAAMEIAAAKLQALYEGKIRMPSGVRSKISGAVKTEAMRIARLIIKDALKAAGEKVSHYAAKEISALAKELVEGEQGKDILAQAQAAISERTEKEKNLKGVIDLSKIKPDATLVKKSKERAERSKKPPAKPAVGHRVSA